MRIPLPFPKCKCCGKAYKTCIHKGCGGKLSIEINTDEVYCDSCSHHWNIWESTYYCTCGAVFKAKEVKQALYETLAFCKACANELKAAEEAKKQRSKISEESIRSFAQGFFKQLGYVFGVAIGTLIDSFVKFFKG